jgi:hypothetical protein
MNRAKILSDILNTVATLDEYYTAAPHMHRTPIQKVYDEQNFGIRPCTPTHKMTAKEEEEELRYLEEEMNKQHLDVKAALEGTH